MCRRGDIKIKKRYQLYVIPLKIMLKQTPLANMYDLSINYIMVIWFAYFHHLRLILSVLSILLAN